MEKTNKRNIEKAALVQKVARINKVSKRYVNMVIAGDRENEDVMNSYMSLLEEGNKLENKLVLAVKMAIPFT